MGDPVTLWAMGTSAKRQPPHPADVLDLMDLLDRMRNFPSNEQRARALLTSNWMREREAAAERRGAAVAVAQLVATTATGRPVRASVRRLQGGLSPISPARPWCPVY